MSMSAFITRQRQLANHRVESRKLTAERLSSCIPTVISARRKKPRDCSRRYKQLMISFPTLTNELGMTHMRAPFCGVGMEEKSITTSIMSE